MMTYSDPFIPWKDYQAGMTVLLFLLLVMALIPLAYWVTLYVFRGIALDRICARAGKKSPLCWVPVGQTALVGELAGKKNYGVLAAVFEGCQLLGIILIWAIYIRMAGGALVCHSYGQFDQYMQDSEVSITIQGLFGILLSFCIVPRQVFNLICHHALYTRLDAQPPVMYTVLGFLFSIHAFFLFFFREHELTNSARPQPGQSYGQPYPGQAGNPYGQPYPGQPGQAYGQPYPGQPGQSYDQPYPGQAGQPYGQPYPGQSGQSYDQPYPGQPGQPYGQPYPGQAGQPYGQPYPGQPGQPYGQPYPGQAGQAYGQPYPGQPRQAYGQPTAEAPDKGQPSAPEEGKEG